ncbi:MFS transporter [Chloroflexota bacterium]
MKEGSNKRSGFGSLFSGLVPLFALAHFSHHLMGALVVPLLPFIRDDFGFDYTQAGLLVSAFSLPYGIGQLPAGWLADRIGPRILITTGICGVALAGFIVGLAPTFIVMIVALVLMGMLGGGYHPASPPLISSLVEPKNRGRTLGFHAAGGSASLFVAAPVAGAIATVWGWRGSFIGLAIPTIIFGIVFYMLLGRMTVKKRTTYMPSSSHTGASRAPGHLRRLVPFIILTTSVAASYFEERLRENVNKSFKFNLIILVPAVVMIMLAGKWLLLAFGQDYSDNGLYLIRILAISSLPFCVSQIYTSVLRVTYRIKELVLFQGLITTIVLLTSYFIIPSNGIMGIGYAWLFTQIVAAIYITACRKLVTYQLKQ